MNETPQSSTLVVPSLDKAPINGGIEREKNAVTQWRHEQYIEYVAAGGIRIHEDGEIEPITVTQFALFIKVDRKTLYNWKDSIPDFWSRVSQRRREIYSGNRVNQVYRAMQLKAQAGDVKAAELILRNYDDNFRQANDKNPNDLGLGLADLLQRVRNSSTPAEIIEAEIVDVNPRSAG